ncbi:MAG: TolC family protein [Bacteroidetes bacterium]|nr:TolC family protein [Bacteroidota bacterium]MCW5896332.1 TolC family protein [Bacteroidota bacterium]
MRTCLLKYCLSVLTMTIVLSISAPAQTGGTQRLSIEDAVRRAVTNNHELAAARHEVGKADAQVREAWGYALPSIDLSGRYTRAIKKPVFFFPNIFDSAASKRGEVTAIEIGSDNSFDLTMTVSQVLFNSAVFTGVGTAKIYSRAAREVYRSKLLETVTTARKALYGVLLAAEVKTMLDANLKNAEDNFRNASVLAAQGLISEYEKLRAEVGLANVRPEVIRAEGNLELAINGLKLALGIPFDQSIEVEGTLEFKPVEDGILEEAPRTVLKENPGLIALRYQEDVNNAFTAIERSEYLPSLAAFGNYQFQAQKNDLRISTHDVVRSSVVGLSLTLNIFNGLRTGARVEQAELETRKTQESIQKTEISLQTAVHSTLMSLKRARERVEAQGRTVELAEQGYRIAATRFNSGSGTQLEVTDAQLALTTAKTNRTQAVYDYHVASMELDQLLGRAPHYISSEYEE